MFCLVKHILALTGMLVFVRVLKLMHSRANVCESSMAVQVKCYYYRYYLQFKKIIFSSLNEVLWTYFHSCHTMIQWLAAGFVQQ